MFDKLFRALTRSKQVEKSIPVMAEASVPPKGQVICLGFGGSELERRLDDDTRMRMWRGGPEEKMFMYYVMKKTRFTPIIEDIKIRFSEKQVGVRGIMAMVGVDDTVVSWGRGTKMVAELGKIMSSGTEHIGDNKVLIARLGLADDIDDNFPEQVGKYLCSSVSHTLGRSEDNGDKRDTLVPVILVYDLSQDTGLTHQGGYDHDLPIDSQRRAGVIIGAYPIDIRNLLPRLHN